jgi:hypothetical protein
LVAINISDWLLDSRTRKRNSYRQFPIWDDRPAYEWNFSDVNPPVHAWATIFLYRTEQAFTGKGDLEFLKRSFAKLILNFSWWVNRKERFGKNLFEGGFLGLDNIGVFDRSAALPTGFAKGRRASELKACVCNRRRIAIALIKRVSGPWRGRQ